MAESGPAKSKSTRTPENDSSKKKPSNSSRSKGAGSGPTTNRLASGDGASAAGTAGKPGKEEKTVVIAIDLTDPEDLMAKLAVLHLSEAEEEQLLQDAYRINKKLKEELSKQEFEDMKITRSYTISASSASILDSQRRRTTAPSRPLSKKSSPTSSRLSSSPYKTKTAGAPSSAKKKVENKVSSMCRIKPNIYTNNAHSLLRKCLKSMRNVLL